MFRNALEPWHLLIVVVVVIALFGSKRLPDTARALGKSLRILKSEATAMKDDTPPAPGPPASTPRDAPGQPVPHAVTAAPGEAPRHRSGEGPTVH
ncbi:Sec-independent protein translocase subunit TatA [Streptomyces sp. NPDC051776]|uniref:Sec-independent protein translocase subunit TatA n=1 Tax=Streptomyces sp. NPDC051776 TaxID=3155414 RepID=UPI0034303E0E